MADFQQLAQRLTPILVTLMEAPFWVSVCRQPPGCEPPARPVLEFWAGLGFDHWGPRDDCVAIIVVVPATAVAGPAAPARQQAFSSTGEAGPRRMCSLRAGRSVRRPVAADGPQARGRRAAERALVGRHPGQVRPPARGTRALRPGTGQRSKLNHGLHREGASPAHSVRAGWRSD
jgi:hypothetical protein